MSTNIGQHYIQEELDFNPRATKDWSELDHHTARSHLTHLARSGEDIHDIIMPEAPAVLKGADLVRAVMAGTVKVEEPEEPDVLPVAKIAKQIAQPSLSGREMAGRIDNAIRHAETALGRSLTDQELIDIASETERAARNGR